MIKVFDETVIKKKSISRLSLSSVHIINRRAEVIPPGCILSALSRAQKSITFLLYTETSGVTTIFFKTPEKRKHSETLSKRLIFVPVYGIFNGKIFGYANDWAIYPAKEAFSVDFMGNISDVFRPCPSIIVQTRREKKNPLFFRDGRRCGRGPAIFAHPFMLRRSTPTP